MISTDVVVVGAGPAGLAAATAAAQHSRRVLVLDDNPSPGGQIWRAGGHEHRDGAKLRALRRFAQSGAELLAGCRVFDAPGPSRLSALREANGAEESITIHYGKVILATGARERFLPFPGWTLPGVFGAGGLQALVKSGYSVRGKRIVVAGSGPLLLAVAAYLRGAGAEIVTVAEQASFARLARFGASLASDPGKLWQGAQYRTALAGTPYRAGCWPVEAIPGSDGLRAVRLTDGKRSWEEPCDLLACGYHLVPNTELASLLGCAFSGEFIQVDGEQRTSVPEVFCVGEPTGIGGLDAALTQGEIAGLACAGKQSQTLQKRAARQRHFTARLEETFALRPELQGAVTPETIVCRCEDVPLKTLAEVRSFAEAKIQTRCGMGPCQGRICGPAVGLLFGWKQPSVRPPIFPVPLAALCRQQDQFEENA
jgi:NADPH-dependent 2,4-dienoyl-CoA reductase/sulfur reductase-like enzyme